MTSVNNNIAHLLPSELADSKPAANPGNIVTSRKGEDFAQKMAPANAESGLALSGSIRSILMTETSSSGHISNKSVSFSDTVEHHSLDLNLRYDLTAKEKAKLFISKDDFTLTKAELQMDLQMAVRRGQSRNGYEDYASIDDALEALLLDCHRKDNSPPMNLGAAASHDQLTSDQTDYLTALKGHLEEMPSLRGTEKYLSKVVKGITIKKRSMMSALINKVQGDERFLRLTPVQREGFLSHHASKVSQGSTQWALAMANIDRKITNEDIARTDPAIGNKRKRSDNI